MEGKLTLRQSEIISEVLAKKASDIYHADYLKNIREDLTKEFSILNSQTDFQSTPSVIPPEWLDAAVLASVRRVVDLHASQRIFD
jgi:hypothetical protein